MSYFFVNFQNDSVFISFDLKRQAWIAEHFNFERKKSESISTTLKKIENRIESAFKKKKVKDDSINIQNRIKLLDENSNEIISESNENAWKAAKKLILLDNEYEILIDSAKIKSLTLPSQMIAGLSAILELTYEFGDAENDRTTVKWFREDPEADRWILFDEGLNKRVCFLPGSTTSRRIKVEATPNDLTCRTVEIISSCKVDPKVDLERFPMHLAHDLTKNQLENDE